MACQQPHAAAPCRWTRPALPDHRDLHSGSVDGRLLLRRLQLPVSLVCRSPGTSLLRPPTHPARLPPAAKHACMPSKTSALAPKWASMPRSRVCLQAKPQWPLCELDLPGGRHHTKWVCRAPWHMPWSVRVSSAGMSRLLSALSWAAARRLHITPYSQQPAASCGGRGRAEAPDMFSRR